MTLRIPESSWKFYGFAGHYILGHRCSYHLTTRIGAFLISTVGQQRDRDGEKIVALNISNGAFFETMVFPCDGEDEFGNPKIMSLKELRVQYYTDSMEAERGHYKMCYAYANLDQLGKGRLPRNFEKDGDDSKKN